MRSHVRAFVFILLVAACAVGQQYSTHQLKQRNHLARSRPMIASSGGYGYQVLYNFCTLPGCADGMNPADTLIQDGSGNVYGTTAGGGNAVSTCPYFGGTPGSTCGTVFMLSPPAQAGGAWTETVLYKFCSSANCTDGDWPIAGLVRDSAGNLYGTTYGGGLPNCPVIAGGHGCGTVFELSPPAQAGGNWTESVLYNFCSLPNCTDGEAPYGGLLLDAAGNLYGTTTTGGAINDNYKGGTLFKLARPAQAGGAWTETVVFNFCTSGYCGNGLMPESTPIMDSAGNLYGTTAEGATYCQSPSCTGGGEVFKLAPSSQSGGAWTETTLHGFCTNPSCPDGESPNPGVVMDAAGNLYGSTGAGGTSTNANCQTFAGYTNCGTVFKIDTTGKETLLYNFCSATGCTDGDYPVGVLIQDPSGNLYGATRYGGSNSGYGDGVVFKLSPPSQPGSSWTETVLYSFCADPNCTDGGSPFAGLMADSFGNLYGTTYLDGANGAGIVYALVAPPTPTVSLTLSAANITPSQALTVTIAVAGTAGSPTPTGTVTLYSGSYSSAPTALANGSATVNIPAGSLPAGTDKLTAAYSGDANFNSALGSQSVIVTPFSLSGTPASVNPGGTTTSTITVTPSGSFTGAVTLSATITSAPSGAQNPPTFSFGSTSPLSINGSSATSATLTISTTPTASAALAVPPTRGIGWYAACATGLFGVVLFGIPATTRKKRTHWMGLTLLLLIAGVSLGCGGGSTSGNGANNSSSGTTPGSYIVTVTGTSGNSTATSTITLTVQ
jgi:hypothetical protein